MDLNLVIRKILYVSTIVGIWIGADAQPQKDSTVVRKFLISYQVNETVLYEHYHDKANYLRIIQEYFKESPRIDSIVIYSYASPEGPYKLN